MFTSRAVCYTTNTAYLEVYHGQLQLQQNHSDLLRSHRAALSLITRQRYHSTAKLDAFSYAQITGFYDPLSTAASNCPTDFSTSTEEPGTRIDMSGEVCQHYDAAILMTPLFLRHLRAAWTYLLCILSMFHVLHAPAHLASCSTNSQDSMPDLQSCSSSLSQHFRFWRSTTVSSEASTPDHGPYDVLHLLIFPGSTVQHDLDWLDTGVFLDPTTKPLQFLQCPDDISQSVFWPGEARQIRFQLLLYCTVVPCGTANHLLTFAKRARILLGWGPTLVYD